MKNESELSFWETSYEEGKTGWDRGAVHPALLNWMDTSQLAPCRIIVPGCGNGHEVISLAERGFEVTAIDFAAQPIETLRMELATRNLQCNLVHVDLFDFDPATKFDAVYEQTCLCAIQPAQRQPFEQKIFEWLAPGGTLFALFMQVPTAKQGPPFHCPLFEMKEIFHSNRWVWPNEPQASWPHPNGPINELSFVLKRVR